MNLPDKPTDDLDCAEASDQKRNRFERAFGSAVVHWEREEPNPHPHAKWEELSPSGEHGQDHPECNLTAPALEAGDSPVAESQVAAKPAADRCERPRHRYDKERRNEHQQHAYEHFEHGAAEPQMRNVVGQFKQIPAAGTRPQTVVEAYAAAGTSH